jgi:predicted Zn-dependent protease
MRTTSFYVALLFVFLTGCSVNPVTGKRDFMTMSPEADIEIGKQNYAPMQQSQGGAYDVDPELMRYVQRIGGNVAGQSGVSLPYEFVVLNSSVPNAWALPGGKIAINRGLLTELNSEAELAAVLGHEAVHAAARHTAKQMSRGQLAQLSVAATAIATSNSEYGNLFAGGAGVLAQLGLSKYGRGAELESDLYGMRYMSKAGYDPQGAVDLQKTFVRLSEGRQSDWVSGLFASHPPSNERVRANINTATTLPAGGKSGVEEYRAAMQQTMKNIPAYEAYDEGRKALIDGNIDEALALANKALGIYNGEAHFHSLRGDIRLAADKYDMAITNYDRAVNRRDGFFYYHLQRGLAKKELGRTDAAEVDLNRSLELLPTAPAHFTLGEISADRGDTATAIEHYKVVAKAGGEYGKAATLALLKLDLPSNPGAYIPSACERDANGTIIASIRNDTGARIKGVQVSVNYSDTSGRAASRQHSINGEIEPGRIASVNTGINAYASGTACTTKVISAQLVE